MIVPVQIEFRALEHSPAIEAYARRRAAKLQLFGRLTGCRVLVEGAHPHGKRYHVRIELGTRGGELVVSRNPVTMAHEGVYACIDAAFDDAQRMLQDYVRRRRHAVKHHEPARPRVRW